VNGSLRQEAIRALTPFGELAEQMWSSRDGELIYSRANIKGTFRITVGDLREARSTLQQLRREVE